MPFICLSSGFNGEIHIQVEKTVDTELNIPKMLVQIHVENALKHGIRTLKTGGKIDIRISKEVKGVKIEIEDNGIGREKSKWVNSGKIGIGLKTIKQIIELNNQKSRQKIKQKIIDLKDQKGSATGTLVVLKFIEKG